MMSSRSMIALRSAGMGRAIAARGIAFTATQRLGLKESSSRKRPSNPSQVYLAGGLACDMSTKSNSTIETNTDYEKHKRDSLDKQKKGTGHWKPELASDSEEAIKADRHSKESTAELQERTKRVAEENAKSGTSVRDGM